MRTMFPVYTFVAFENAYISYSCMLDFHQCPLLSAIKLQSKAYFSGKRQSLTGAPAGYCQILLVITKRFW